MKDKSWWFPFEKRELPPGPWMREPEKIQWTTRAGFPGLIRRNQVGALCGYVGVPEAHPAFMRPYKDLIDSIDVHGCLTFSAFCSDERDGICHEVGPGDDDRVWWLGFDCGHAGDVVPGIMGYAKTFADGDYRTVDYVTREVEHLAVQLFVMGGA